MTEPRTSDAQLLRSRYVAADSAAEELKVFDLAMDELRQLLKELEGRGKVARPPDFKALRQRFINSISLIDRAVVFDSLQAQVERLDRALRPAGKRRAPIRLRMEEEPKAQPSSALEPQPPRAVTAGGAAYSPDKLNLLLESLSRDRLEALSLAEELRIANRELENRVAALKRDNASLKASLQAESSGRETLESEFGDEILTLRKTVQSLQKERDGLKKRVQEMMEESGRLRSTLEELSSEYETVREKHKKLLDENSSLKTGMFSLALEQLRALETKMEKLQRVTTGARGRRG